MDNYFEAEDSLIIKGDSIFYNIEHGLGYEYFHAMKKYKNRTGQIIVSTEEEDPYESILQRSIRTALKLKSKNLNQEDVICLCSNNNKNSCIPLFAALFLNIQVASLDPSLSPKDTTHLINLVKPKILFIIRQSEDLIRKALEDLGLDPEIVILEDLEDFMEYLEDNDEENDFEPRDVDNVFETAVIYFSSGTTGLPKGICLSHYSILYQSQSMQHAGYINFGYTTLAFTSLYWTSGLLHLTNTTLKGCARIICSKFDPVDLWLILDKYKINLLFVAPIHIIEMLRVGRPDNLDTTSLQTLITGGSSLSEQYLQSLRDLLPGTFIVQVYGQTELAGILTFFNLTKVKDTLQLHEKPNSVGKPIPGLVYKIVDTEDESKICAPNEFGELRVKSKCVMNGYYQKDASESFDEDGWLKTGDVVYFDQDFCFYVVDRIKEMLKYKSWHVAPAVVENTLQKHPAIKQVVVIGIPDEVDGDLPAAIIVLREDFKDIDRRSIEDFAEEHLDEREQLRGGVRFVDQIPITATGKIARNQLRDMVLLGKI